MAEQSSHIPVLSDEVLKYLSLQPGDRVLDATVGAGGHAEQILSTHSDVSLLGLDRDETALKLAQTRLAPFGERASLIKTPFSSVGDALEQHGWRQVDKVLMDIGISSMQIDEASRGFSYFKDGPLDLRMDQRSQVTAARVLNTRSVDELTRIFREFGEEKQARRIANAVVRRRETQPWARTGEFAELIEATVGRTPRGKLPSPARCFQALRIYLNNELEELEKALESVISHLSPGGRLVVISFHSLEDRIVKKRFLFEACECVCPPDFPVCRCEKVSRLRVLTRRPITATGDELDLNPRARSAKLRAAEKLTQD